MAGLRERNRTQRVNAILDAAVELFDRHPLDDVTAEHIAERAGVSTATVYNLVGTRDRLLRALVSRLLDRLVEAIDDAVEWNDRPLIVARRISELAVSACTEHSVAYRRVVAAGWSVERRITDELLDPSELQVAAIRRAQEIGELRADIDPVALGRQSYLSWIGAMQHWANGDLDDEGFRAATSYGLLVSLAAAAVEPHRQRLIDEMVSPAAELRKRWRAN